MDATRVGEHCAAAAALVTLVWFATPAPRWRPPYVAGIGTIMRGSIVPLGPLGHRLTLEHPFAIDQGWPAGETIEVAYLGELPDTVCDGTQIYVSGTATATGVVATVLAADQSKYDRCFQLHCHREAYNACRGRSF